MVNFNSIQLAKERGIRNSNFKKIWSLKLPLFLHTHPPVQEIHHNI